MKCIYCDTNSLSDMCDGSMVCTNCGVVQQGFVNAPDFTTQVFKPTTTYKRPNHFKKILGLYPEITRSEAQTLNERFKQLQRAFERNRGNRRNMLPYRFVLHKLCQMLTFPHTFNISKSRDKLQEQTDLWLLICYDMNWLKR